jgi:hypothetical protein
MGIAESNHGDVHTSITMYKTDGRIGDADSQPASPPLTAIWEL